MDKFVATYADRDLSKIIVGLELFAYTCFTHIWD